MSSNSIPNLSNPDLLGGVLGCFNLYGLNNLWPCRHKNLIYKLTKCLSLFTVVSHAFKSTKNEDIEMIICLVHFMVMRHGFLPIKEEHSTNICER